MTDPPQVPLGGSRDGCFGINENIRFPPRAVNLFECDWLDCSENAANSDRPKRDQIRITAHETDASAVLHDLNDVAREQCTVAVRTACPV
jgi:hypothetical protein